MLFRSEAPAGNGRPPSQTGRSRARGQAVKARRLGRSTLHEVLVADTARCQRAIRTARCPGYVKIRQPGPTSSKRVVKQGPRGQAVGNCPGTSGARNRPEWNRPGIVQFAADPGEGKPPDPGRVRAAGDGCPVPTGSRRIDSPQRPEVRFTAPGGASIQIGRASCRERV